MHVQEKRELMMWCVLRLNLFAVSEWVLHASRLVEIWDVE